ncbi:MAG: hypothetical protein K0S76_1571 [Herbinix sp.]|jgi:hypothetical protein|nr:hypothetical protein [Herbinix sp.]
MSTNHPLQFFLGSNTKRGFVSLFEEFRKPASGRHLYILKGGPGSGKSTLMRRIAKTLEDIGHSIEYIPCASDPNSLDAFYDKEAGIAMIDGTAPHTMEPKYPGAYDTIINLGDVWDNDELYHNRKKIMELSNMISLYHSMATSCITSAAALLDCNQKAAEAYVNQKSVHSFLGIIGDELSLTSKGCEKIRLLSAVSVGKLEFFEETLTQLSPKLYKIPDEWGAASGTLLAALHDHSLAMLYEMITCYCSIHTPEQIDHLIFPHAKVGVSTANTFHNVNSKDCIVIEGLYHPMKKTLTDTLNLQLTFAKNLIETAGSHVAKAKLYHDELEAFYISAMNFSRVDEISGRIINEIVHTKPQEAPIQASPV